MDGKVLTQMIDTLSCVEIGAFSRGRWRKPDPESSTPRSAYTNKLPITLLVGIATTADALWTLLGRKTDNKLDAATFFVDPGVGAFNALMRGVSPLRSKPNCKIPELTADPPAVVHRLVCAACAQPKGVRHSLAHL